MELGLFDASVGAVGGKGAQGDLKPGAHGRGSSLVSARYRAKAAAVPHTHKLELEVA